MLLVLLATLSLFATTIGAVQIHSYARNDLCIDVQDANFAKGTPVQLWECNGTPAQDWEWGKWDSYYHWRVVGTNWCMKFVGASNYGEPMALMDCNGTDSYLNYWEIHPVNNINAHFILSTGPYGRVALDVKGDINNGAKLQLWYEDQCNPNQMWTW